jgi:hypothetical protein
MAAQPPIFKDTILTDLDKKKIKSTLAFADTGHDLVKSSERVDDEHQPIVVKRIVENIRAVVQLPPNVAQNRDKTQEYIDILKTLSGQKISSISAIEDQTVDYFEKTYATPLKTTTQVFLTFRQILNKIKDIKTTNPAKSDEQCVFEAGKGKLYPDSCCILTITMEGTDSWGIFDDKQKENLGLFYLNFYFPPPDTNNRYNKMMLRYFCVDANIGHSVGKMLASFNNVFNLVTPVNIADSATTFNHMYGRDSCYFPNDSIPYSSNVFTIDRDRPSSYKLNIKLERSPSNTYDFNNRYDFSLVVEVIIVNQQRVIQDRKEFKIPFTKDQTSGPSVPYISTLIFELNKGISIDKLSPPSGKVLNIKPLIKSMYEWLTKSMNGQRYNDILARDLIIAFLIDLKRTGDWEQCNIGHYSLTKSSDLLPYKGSVINATGDRLCSLYGRLIDTNQSYSQADTLKMYRVIIAGNLREEYIKITRNLIGIIGAQVDMVKRLPLFITACIEPLLTKIKAAAKFGTVSSATPLSNALVKHHLLTLYTSIKRSIDLYRGMSSASASVSAIPPELTNILKFDVDNIPPNSVFPIQRIGTSDFYVFRQDAGGKITFFDVYYTTANYQNIQSLQAAAMMTSAIATIPPKKEFTLNGIKFISVLQYLQEEYSKNTYSVASKFLKDVMQSDDPLDSLDSLTKIKDAIDKLEFLSSKNIYQLCKVRFLNYDYTMYDTFSKGELHVADIGIRQATNLVAKRLSCERRFTDLKWFDIVNKMMSFTIIFPSSDDLYTNLKDLLGVFGKQANIAKLKEDTDKKDLAEYNAIIQRDFRKIFDSLQVIADESNNAKLSTIGGGILHSEDKKLYKGGEPKTKEEIEDEFEDIKEFLDNSSELHINLRNRSRNIRIDMQEAFRVFCNSLYVAFESIIVKGRFEERFDNIYDFYGYIRLLSLSEKTTIEIQTIISIYEETINNLPIENFFRHVDGLNQRINDYTNTITNNVKQLKVQRMGKKNKTAYNDLITEYEKMLKTLEDERQSFKLDIGDINDFINYFIVQIIISMLLNNDDDFHKDYETLDECIGMHITREGPGKRDIKECLYSFITKTYFTDKTIKYLADILLYIPDDLFYKFIPTLRLCIEFTNNIKQKIVESQKKDFLKIILFVGYLFNCFFVLLKRLTYHSRLNANRGISMFGYYSSQIATFNSRSVEQTLNSFSKGIRSPDQLFERFFVIIRVILNGLNIFIGNNPEKKKKSDYKKLVREFTKNGMPRLEEHIGWSPMNASIELSALSRSVSMRAASAHSNGRKTKRSDRSPSQPAPNPSPSTTSASSRGTKKARAVASTTSTRRKKGMGTSRTTTMDVNDEG